KEKWSTKYNGGEPMNTQQAIDILKGSLAVTPLRNTSLIEIKAYSDNKDEAAQLANAVAEAYREFRLGRSTQKMSAGIMVLTNTIEMKEKEYRDAQAEVDRLRE